VAPGLHAVVEKAPARAVGRRSANRPFLASAQSSFILGANLYADGGEDQI
jgi:hypothetical protein